MIISLLSLLVAAYQPHPREHPKATLEWLDHYDYCLDVNFAQVLETNPAGGAEEAAKRAVIRCWPVHVSTKKKLISDLVEEDGESDANEREEIANRLLTIVATAFAARVGLKAVELGPLSPMP
ncbi:MAG: hypothetical protein R3E09_14950 [Novosphingobium sp.]